MVKKCLSIYLRIFSLAAPAFQEFILFNISKLQLDPLMSGSRPFL